MKKRIRAVLLLLTFICSLMLSGCGDDMVQNTPDDSFYERSEIDEEELASGYKSNIDKIYQDAYERFSDPEETEEWEGDDIFDKLLRKILGGYHRAYRVIRTLSVYIWIGSLIIGVFMIALSRKNKKVRHAGLYIFIIATTILMILVVFGVGIANAIFLY